MNEAKIKWAPRLRQDKLLRLYQSNAKRITDGELLQDVALTLYLRCKDIMAIYDAHNKNQIRCPACHERGRTNHLSLPDGLDFREKDAYLLECPCGFAFTWREFRSSHKQKQLNAGGAVRAFVGFINQYERRPDDDALMLAVDRLIHEFHYSLKSQPDVPTRIAGANLIEGPKTTQIMAFLNELTYNTDVDARLADSAAKWREDNRRLGYSYPDP